ncbi:HNH endonuclease [Methylocystis sp. JR02]|uniref:HNH endonuclease n=1 Tax=Methylocystis sp. JR02 TaxID=3046284 RepID=UPI0024BB7907|nr:HNH endonuclease [Methylocystis sp. JR02]MDJ0449774.1 HNH endonuclease [Methylocystis sp. JR02]
MAKAVFTTKSSSAYDDLPEIRYHFPKIYLNQVSKAVGDWVVYYEPRRLTTDPASRGGAQVYFATARLERVILDDLRPDHYYAEVSNYLPFVRPVAFREGGSFYETRLRKSDGSTNKGAFGRAVRNITDAEFDAIWQAGFGHVIGLEERIRPLPDVPEAPMQPILGFAEGRTEFQLAEEPFEQDRKVIEQLVSRPFRDRAFSAAVKDAYGDTCAMSGIKIINGSGRSEVQAAHIRPVEQRGPDSVRNGIALSGTFHWMFDRGLISIDDDYSLLLAREKLPDSIDRLLGGNTRLLVPQRGELRPHPQFIAWHRREIFKG